jgi:membrane-associated protein
VLPSAALDGQLNGWLDAFGPFLFYVIVWGLVFVGTGFFVGAFVPFITGDSLLFAAGLIAASSSNINVAILVGGVFIAAFLGDQVGFIIGRHYGRPYLDKRGGRKTQLMIRKTENFYLKYGWWAVVVARFMPWARVIIPVVAGVGRMNYYKFLTSNFGTTDSKDKCSLLDMCWLDLMLYSSYHLFFSAFASYSKNYENSYFLIRFSVVKIYLDKHFL